MIGHNAHRNENRREETTTRLGGRVGRSREKQRGKRDGRSLRTIPLSIRLDQCSRRYWLPVLPLIVFYPLEYALSSLISSSASTFPIPSSLIVFVSPCLVSYLAIFQKCRQLRFYFFFFFYFIVYQEPGIDAND